MKVAVVHDWLTGIRGGEKVLEQILDIFPGADIFTLIYRENKIPETIKKHKIKTSFLQRVPGIFSVYRNFLPFFPAAIESFDLKRYSLIISSSHCVAKGVKAPDPSRHVCYCHTPMRYAWDQFENYFSPKKNGKIKYSIIKKIMPALRKWDRNTAFRAGYYIANSEHVAKRIEKYYSLTADVINPPVDTQFFTPDKGFKDDFFLIVSALTEYKKVDLAVRAFSKIPREKLVVIGDGPEKEKIQKIKPGNVELLGRRSDSEIRDYYRRARAFIFPGEEDFGITMAESLSCGTPVLAFGKGGALEIVAPGQTGEFFDGSREDFIKKLEKIKNKSYDMETLRESGLRFSREVFRKKFTGFLKERRLYEKENT